MRKQTGCLVRRGGWWLLRYRMRVLEKGKLRSVNRAHKLSPVDAQHKTRASVREMAADFPRPFNEGSSEQQPTSRLGEFVEKVYLPYVRDHKRAHRPIADTLICGTITSRLAVETGGCATLAQRTFSASWIK